jgi:hypothetical protein
VETGVKEQAADEKHTGGEAHWDAESNRFGRRK